MAIWKCSVNELTLWEIPDLTYVIELKRAGTPEEALKQIRGKDYSRQFMGDPRPVVELGVTFSTKTCNITVWKINE